MVETLTSKRLAVAAGVLILGVGPFFVVLWMYRGVEGRTDAVISTEAELSRFSADASQYLVTLATAVLDNAVRRDWKRGGYPMRADLAQNMTQEPELWFHSRARDAAA